MLEDGKMERFDWHSDFEQNDT